MVGCYECGKKSRDATSGGELLIFVQASLLTEGLCCMDAFLYLQCSKPNYINEETKIRLNSANAGYSPIPSRLLSKNMLIRILKSCIFADRFRWGLKAGLSL